jgi:hypothetical protein
MNKYGIEWPGKFKFVVFPDFSTTKKRIFKNVQTMKINYQNFKMFRKQEKPVNQRYRSGKII